jgi:hypothetical protein
LWELPRLPAFLLLVRFHTGAFRLLLQNLRYDARAMKKRPRKRPPSYAWVLHAEMSPHYFELSEAADEGLDYARKLADDADYRRERALRGEVLAPLSPAELGERDGLSAQAVAARISQARRQLFGGLSDSGIYYRLARRSELAGRPPKRCEGPGCERLLPRAASRARRYCDGTCRVRAYRARGW